MTREYSCVVSMEWSVSGIEADSVEEFIERVKTIWWEEHNLELSDKEITDIKGIVYKIRRDEYDK